MAGQKKTSAGSGADAPDEDRPPISIWERLDNPAPAPRAVLTPTRIAEAAVAVADAEGIDAVTMRRLATELGVAPMAAYRYVSGKDDVLELMVDLVYGRLALPATGLDWRETLRALAVGTRELMVRHPWLTRLSSPRAALALTPNRMAVAERALLALDGLGLDADAMMAIAETVDTYTAGRARAEVATRELMAGQGVSDGHELRMSLAPQMTWLLGTGRYPTYRRYTREAVRKDDAPWRFETGLDCVLDGVAARMGI
jgi:AcrR family transcriptional regulator